MNTTKTHKGGEGSSVTYEYEVYDSVGDGVTSLRIVRRAGGMYIEVGRTVKTTSCTGIMVSDKAEIDTMLSVMGL